MPSLPLLLLPVQASVALDILERFGVPISMLSVIVFSLFRTASWLAPRIDRLISRHEQLLGKLEDELENHGTVLTNMERTQEMVLGCLRRMEAQDFNNEVP